MYLDNYVFLIKFSFHDISFDIHFISFNQYSLYFELAVFDVDIGTCTVAQPMQRSSVGCSVLYSVVSSSGAFSVLVAQ